MTTLTRALPLLAPHTGTRRKPPTGVPWPIQAVMIAAAIAITVGFLAAAASPRHPATEPRCVRWHSCACRFPGQGSRWPGHNQLCAINWAPAPRPLPHGGGPR